MGTASEETIQQVESWIASHPEIAQEVQEMELALEQFTLAKSIAPSDQVRKKILAKLRVPKLEEDRSLETWQAIANRYPPELDQVIHTQRLAKQSNTLTYLVHAQKALPHEEHDDMQESFLLLEGQMTCWIGETPNFMKAGDYMQIPLHTDHWVEVTSPQPALIILQRQLLHA